MWLGLGCVWSIKGARVDGLGLVPVGVRVSIAFRVVTKFRLRVAHTMGARRVETA